MKKNILWQMLIIIGLVGGFYWFEIRPSEIRKDCINSSMPDAIDRDLFWNSYKLCLANNGLKE